MRKGKRTAFYGLFLALALVAGYVEQLLPVSLGIPGVKLGLANVVTMVLLYTVGVRAAVGITAANALSQSAVWNRFFYCVQRGRSRVQHACHAVIKTYGALLFCQRQCGGRRVPQCGDRSWSRLWCWRRGRWYIIFRY